MEYSLTILKLNIFSMCYHNRFGWIRVFGYGIKFKDVSIYGLMFSERLGISKGIQIGKWRVGFLK